MRSYASRKNIFCKVAPRHFEVTFKFRNKVGEISKQDLDVGKSNNYGIFSIKISAREKLRQNYDGPRKAVNGSIGRISRSSVGEFLCCNGPWSNLFTIQFLIRPFTCKVVFKEK